MVAYHHCAINSPASAQFSEEADQVTLSIASCYQL